MKKHYLIRKQISDPISGFYFQILGPFTVTEVLSMAKNRGIDSTTEASASSDYWFSLGENEEVKKNFFVDTLLIQNDSSSEEITQPNMGSTLKKEDATVEVENPALSEDSASYPNKVEPSQVFTFFMALMVLLCFMSFVWLLRYLRAG